MNNKYKDIQNTIANLDIVDWRQKEFSHPERLIRLGTSFSGIGAIEHAMKRLGLNTQLLFAGDIDDDCKKSYLANYGLDESRWHSDIHDFDASPYKGQVDLFVGGAPCQAFSLRGKHGGFEDTRGTLFREFARVVIECQPKVFIFENVKGMLSHDKGNTWKVIRETFEQDCGYQVYYQILNSKDYGIPQSRDRIYCIGFKSETDFKYPAPIRLEKEVYDFLDSEFSDSLFLKDKGFHFVTEEVNHRKSYTQINGQVQLCQKRNQQFNWHGDFVFHPYSPEITETEEFRKLLHNVEEGEASYYYNQENLGRYVISPKSSITHSMAIHESHSFDQTKGWFRKLSPRECLRLMGFDDSYKIVVSDSAAYKQAGNSIVVNVLMAILKQMDITQYGIII